MLILACYMLTLLMDLSSKKEIQYAGRTYMRAFIKSKCDGTTKSIDQISAVKGIALLFLGLWIKSLNKLGCYYKDKVFFFS